MRKMYGIKFVSKGDIVWIRSKEQRDQLFNYYLKNDPQTNIEKVEKEMETWQKSN